MVNYLKSDDQLLKEGLATTKGAIFYQGKFTVKLVSYITAPLAAHRNALFIGVSRVCEAVK